MAATVAIEERTRWTGWRRGELETHGSTGCTPWATSTTQCGHLFSKPFVTPGESDLARPADQPSSRPADRWPTVIDDVASAPLHLSAPRPFGARRSRSFPCVLHAKPPPFSFSAAPPPVQVPVCLPLPCVPPPPHPPPPRRPAHGALRPNERRPAARHCRCGHCHCRLPLHPLPLHHPDAPPRRPRGQRRYARGRRPRGARAPPPPRATPASSRRASWPTRRARRVPTCTLPSRRRLPCRRGGPAR